MATTEASATAGLIEGQSATTARPAKHRIGGLDGLRGIAAVGVMLYHYTVLSGLRGYDVELISFLKFGNYGVGLFFLVSGFVIAMTVEKTARPVDFAISRFSRLFPTYWTALAFTFLILAIWPEPDADIGLRRLTIRALANIPMIENWFGISLIDGVYWTLHVEMAFYLVFFALLCIHRVDWALFTLMTLIGLDTLSWALPTSMQTPGLTRFRDVSGLNSLQGLTAGVLLYKIRLHVKPIYLILLLLCLVQPFTQHRKYQNPPVDVAVATGFTLLVYLATTGRLRVLDSRLLTYLGTISYALYVIHYEMGRVLIGACGNLGLPLVATIAVPSLMAILMATFMTFQIEKPAMKALRATLERWARPRV